MELKNAILNDLKLGAEVARKAKELLTKQQHLYSGDEFKEELKNINQTLEKIEKDIKFIEKLDEEIFL